MRFPDLAHRGAIVIAVKHGADAFQPQQVLGLVLGKQVILHFVGVAGGFGFVAEIGGIVAQHAVFVEKVHGIKAKAIDAAIQPKPQHAFHIVKHRRIAKVELGLLG